MTFLYMTSLKKKDLLGLEDLTAEEIQLILDTAKGFQEVGGREIKKVPALRGRTVANLFFENSTRTRTSFELAAKRLSADVINVAVSTSSVAKGETLLDTAKNLEAMGASVMVIRHSASGVPHLLAKNLKASVINAGDGSHEHPSQALLDMLTILDHKPALKGLKVAIVGDIAKSRVARSNMHGLTKMGAEVRVIAPATMMPREVEKFGVKPFYDLKQGIKDADVVMMLRIQKERQTMTPYPTLREYAQLFGLKRATLEAAKPDAIVMHPGPVNRGVEMEAAIIDGPRSVILEQVTNGIAVRMAIMYLL